MHLSIYGQTSYMKRVWLPGTRNTKTNTSVFNYGLKQNNMGSLDSVRLTGIRFQGGQNAKGANPALIPIATKDWQDRRLLSNVWEFIHDIYKKEYHFFPDENGNLIPRQANDELVTDEREAMSYMDLFDYKRNADDLKKDRHFAILKGKKEKIMGTVGVRLLTRKTGEKLGYIEAFEIAPSISSETTALKMLNWAEQRARAEMGVSKICGDFYKGDYVLTSGILEGSGFYKPKKQPYQYRQRWEKKLTPMSESGSPEEPVPAKKI